MIDFKKLTEAKRVEVTYAIPTVDGEFVKKFRRDKSLTQVALSNILGVKKKTIEKWEQGVNKIKGSSAVLLSLLSENEGLLSQLYSVKICESGEKCCEEFTTIFSGKSEPILINEPFPGNKFAFAAN